MAKQEYLITSACRENGKVLAKGTILELDMEDKHDGERIAILHRAGRIGLATKENVEAIKQEIKSDQEREKRLQESFNRNSTRAAVAA